MPAGRNIANAWSKMPAARMVRQDGENYRRQAGGFLLNAVIRRRIFASGGVDSQKTQLGRGRWGLRDTNVEAGLFIAIYSGTYTELHLLNPGSSTLARRFHITYSASVCFQ